MRIRGAGLEHEKAEQAKAVIEKEEQPSLGSIVIYTAFASIAVVAAATLLAFSAEVAAQEAGLTDSFVGFWFDRIATTRA